MTNAPATAAAITAGHGARITSQTDSGRVAAPTMEPMEICRVQITTTTNIIVSAATAHGVRHKKAPTKLATALPPRNPKNTGYAWPAMTASAAALIHRHSSNIKRLRLGTESVF